MQTYLYFCDSFENSCIEQIILIILKIVIILKISIFFYLYLLGLLFFQRILFFILKIMNFTFYES